MGAHMNSPKQQSTTPKRHGNSDSAQILSLISHCSCIYTFNNPSESPSQRNLKSERLVNLFSFIKIIQKPLLHQILSPLFTMISSNLFRPLPPPTTCTAGILPDDDDLVMTPAAAWPHLSIVYEILLRLIRTLDANALQDYIDNSFITISLTLFQSEDQRERDSLKRVFHKIYSKFHSSRSFMRKAMNDVLLQYVFETDQRHCGIGDLLEIWGTIINGFSLPLKEEHKVFLTRVLIPLHRPKEMQAYHKQLAYCVYQFVEKEPMIGAVVIRGILKYWPVTNCQKEVLLIGEVEDLVDNMESEQYEVVALPICRQITQCLNSCNSQVAERALYVWNNERFVKMATEAAGDVFPVLVQGIERNLEEHWNRCVRELTENVKQMFVDMEPVLYSKCLSDLDHRNAEAKEEDSRRRQRWEKIQTAANINRFIKQIDHSFWF